MYEIYLYVLRGLSADEVDCRRKEPKSFAEHLIQVLETVDLLVGQLLGTVL